MFLSDLPTGHLDAFPTHVTLAHFGPPEGIVIHIPARSAADAAQLAAAFHQLPDEPVDVLCRARDSLTSVIETASLEIVELFDSDAGLLWKRDLGLISGPG